MSWDGIITRLNFCLNRSIYLRIGLFSWFGLFFQGTLHKIKEGLTHITTLVLYQPHYLILVNIFFTTPSLYQSAWGLACVFVCHASADQSVIQS